MGFSAAIRVLREMAAVRVVHREELDLWREEFRLWRGGFDSVV